MSVEPIMRLEVVGPADCMPAVISDLNSRHGQIIRGLDMRFDATIVTAMVQLKNMFGYANDLRSISHGRASFTMRFDHYAPTTTPSSY